MGHQQMHGVVVTPVAITGTVETLVVAITGTAETLVVATTGTAETLVVVTTGMGETLVAATTGMTAAVSLEVALMDSMMPKVVVVAMTPAASKLLLATVLQPNTYGRDVYH